MAEITYRASFALNTYSPSSDWAPSLHAQVEHRLPFCRSCLHQSPVSQAANSMQLGTIAYLPPERSIPSDSIIRHQPAANKGAYKHPGLALLESECGHLFFVAPMTSFDGAGIEAKYTRVKTHSRNNIFWRYLAVKDELTSPHNDLLSLETTGDKLSKASYIHLDQGYWIEKGNLTPMGSHQGRLTVVTPAALSYAQWAYGVAEKHRVSQGIDSEALSLQLEQDRIAREQAAYLSQAPFSYAPISYTQTPYQGMQWMHQTLQQPWTAGIEQNQWAYQSPSMPVMMPTQGQWRNNIPTIPWAVGQTVPSYGYWPQNH